MDIRTIAGASIIAWIILAVYFDIPLSATAVVGLVLVAWFIMTLKLITLPCFGCSEAGWWYRCKDGTGKLNGVKSEGCQNWEAANKLLDDAKRETMEMIDRLYNIKSDVVKPIADALVKVQDTLSGLKINIPTIAIPSLLAPNMSCSLTIPVVGKLDLCSEFKKVLDEAIKQTNKALGAAGGVIEQGLREAMNVMFANLAKLPAQLQQQFDEMKKPIENLVKEITEASTSIKNLYSLAEKIGWINVILMLIANWIQRLIGISLQVAIFIAVLIVTVPILGASMGVINLVNDLIF